MLTDTGASMKSAAQQGAHILNGTAGLVNAGSNDMEGEEVERQAAVDRP